METTDDKTGGVWKPVKVTLYVKVLVQPGDDEDAVLEDVRIAIEDEVFDFDNITQDGFDITQVHYR